jgi:hypothetical protein
VLLVARTSSPRVEAPPFAQSVYVVKGCEDASCSFNSSVSPTPAGRPLCVLERQATPRPCIAWQEPFSAFGKWRSRPVAE